MEPEQEVNVVRYNALKALEQTKQSRRQLGTRAAGQIRFADGAITAVIASAIAPCKRKIARTRLLEAFKLKALLLLLPLWVHSCDILKGPFKLLLVVMSKHL